MRKIRVKIPKSGPELPLKVGQEYTTRCGVGVTIVRPSSSRPKLVEAEVRVVPADLPDELRVIAGRVGLTFWLRGDTGLFQWDRVALGGRVQLDVVGTDPQAERSS